VLDGVSDLAEAVMQLLEHPPVLRGGDTLEGRRVEEALRASYGVDAVL
jgi:hypothetical protein